jgi:hypothetical protein
MVPTERANKWDGTGWGTYDLRDLGNNSHAQPDQTLLSSPVSRLVWKRRNGNDLTEEESSEVVVPLTQKSSEHKEEQKSFREESGQRAI